MQNQNNLTTKAQIGSASHSDRQQAGILVNKIFNGLKAIFPAWAAAIKDQDYQNQAKAEWLKGLIENGITSDHQIEAGFVKARAHNSPFLPSIGQFIEWCKQATGVNHPPMEAVFAELQEWLKVNRKDWHNSSPLLQHIIRRNLDLYNYKQVFKDYDRVKLFEIAYKAALFQFESGIEMESYPHPKTLIEDKPYSAPATPAVIEKTQDVRAGIFAMLDDKPEQKPLTEAEIKDREKLEKIKTNNFK